MENKNKDLIKKLRDNAELAWSAYGYYDFFTEPFYHMYLLDDNKQAHYIKDITDIMNISYMGRDVYVADLIFPNREGIKVGTLKGDFSPLQAKRFFLTMICLYISQIQNLDSLLLCLVKKENKRIQNLKK